MNLQRSPTWPLNQTRGQGEKLRPLLNPKGGAVKWVEGGGEVDPGRLPPLELNPLHTFFRRTLFLIFVHQSRGGGGKGSTGPQYSEQHTQVHF